MNEIKRKEIVYKATTELYDKVVTSAMNLGYELDNDLFIINGTLQDSCLIISNYKIKIGKANPRKYIIFESVYVNEWSSELQMILTDDDKKADKFYTEYVVQNSLEN